MSNDDNQPTFRIRRSCGAWYVRVFEGFTVNPEKETDCHGPFTHKEANEFAVSLDIADGDKGREQSDVRGHQTKVA